MKFIKKNWPLLLLLAIGFALRMYEPAVRLQFDHDQDLLGWFARDVVVNKHLRLIGQQTSTMGVFIGPLFYYFITIFYAIFKMSPMGGVWAMAILGVFTIWSFYFVFERIFNKQAGLIAATIYTFSNFFILNDRKVVPTSLVFLWTVWFFYGLNLLLKGKQKRGLIILGILAGLIWQINFALVILIPLVLLALVISKKKIDTKALGFGVLVFGIVFSPFLIFELRHGFLQTRAIWESLTTDQGNVIVGFYRFEKIVNILLTSAANMFLPFVTRVKNKNYFMAMAILILFGIVLKRKKKEYLKYLPVFASWLILYLLFFWGYSKQVSEYYLDGTVLVWLILAVLILKFFLEKKETRKIGYGLLAGFVLLNLNAFVNFVPPNNGYWQRRELVREIKRDAKVHDYPCVAISYIADPGHDLGYRYLLWLEGIKVKKPISEAPVYTIVFPHSRVDDFDKAFGGLALILPEYSKYDERGVLESCRGEDVNVTEPMFGYTE